VRAPVAAHGDRGGAVVGESTASAVYQGTVRHRRFAVRSHEFRQRLTLAYLDLDELPGLLGGSLLSQRPGLPYFRRSDYLGDARLPLGESVRDTVEAQIGKRPHGPIRLLANLSALGHCFNPVSFYYCMDRAGEGIEAVVAEVTNTPWGERHSYVLGADASVGDGTRVVASTASGRRTSVASSRVLSGSFAKALHVSPFMGIDHRYEWRITAPAETLSVHIASNREDRLAFDATLALRRHPLTSASLVRLTTTTLRTLVSIYAQAGMLKLKGLPVHTHPGVEAA
jgi:DUF1365 family protein